MDVRHTVRLTMTKLTGTVKLAAVYVDGGDRMACRFAILPPDRMKKYYFVAFW